MKENVQYGKERLGNVKQHIDNVKLAEMFISPYCMVGKPSLRLKELSRGRLNSKRGKT